MRVLKACVLVLAATGWWLSSVEASCKDQFRNAMYAAGKNYTYYEQFIDDNTPDTACTISLCSDNNFDICDPVQHQSDVPKTDYILIYSDEFNTEKQDYSVEKEDIRWTAEDMYYFPTQDYEVYKPDRVTTAAGAMVINMDRTPKPEFGITQQPNGDKWKVPKNYASGMLSGWNKWCFTGGYLEASVMMPGDPYVSGPWPAFWLMGNLGRQGYMKSTSGLWPYSYNTCGQGSAMNSSIPGSKVPSQILSACPDDPEATGVNRTKYGMAEGVARSAPEFDVFEVSSGGMGPHASQTLQMAPLVPEGQNWDDLEWYEKNGYPQGLNFPGGITARRTNMNEWDGIFGRPGNEFQDSYSAVSAMNESFYTSYHTWGVDWKPKEYLRWYIDGQLVYDVNKYALMERTDGQTTIGTRQIPYEAMYIIFNLGISKAFGVVDVANLRFPMEMKVDYVRVYQEADKLNVGCSPPDLPTEQWIACHRNDYITHDKDKRLIKAVCNGAAPVFTRLGLLLLLLGLILF